MSRKIWYIDDANWKGTARKVVSDPSPLEEIWNNFPTREGKGEAIRPIVASPPNNPALSFSLSMFVWGSGQIYSAAYRPGSIFLLLMAVFYGSLAAMAIYWEPASRFVGGMEIPTPVLLLAGILYLLAGLVVWLFNVVDAYYRTLRVTAEPFWGVENRLWPPLCSLLFPGWGQFLNGQPIKGIFFLFSGAMGSAALYLLFITPTVWPVFKGGTSGPLFELALVASLLLVPVYLLIWIISVYDSLVISRLHGSLPPGYRKNNQGVLRNILPRTTAVLSLLLAISVGMQCLPREFYLNSLEKIRVEAMRKDMEKIPVLAGEAIELIGR